MKKPILIEAHRGDSTHAPPNTLAAFRRAVEMGAPCIELDVRPSRDGRLMVIHDEKVDRATNGCGVVCDMTAAELRCLDAGCRFAPAFAGEKIPLLDEVMALLAPTRTVLNIEIKSFPPSADVPEAVVALLRGAGREREYVVSSFDLPTLLRVREIAPEIALALIGKGPEILPVAIGHHLDWVHAHHATATEALITEAHSAGIHVNIWTLDDPSQFPHWRHCGVDKICTNDPAAMLVVAQE